MGKIGKDAFGTIVKKQIAEYVSTDSMIEAEGENTSYSVVIAPKGIDRMFLHCPGANWRWRKVRHAWKQMTRSAGSELWRN